MLFCTLFFTFYFHPNFSFQSGSWPQTTVTLKVEFPTTNYHTVGSQGLAVSSNGSNRGRINCSAQYLQPKQGGFDQVLEGPIRADCSPRCHRQAGMLHFCTWAWWSRMRLDTYKTNAFVQPGQNRSLLLGSFSSNTVAIVSPPLPLVTHYLLEC